MSRLNDGLFGTQRQYRMKGNILDQVKVVIVQGAKNSSHFAGQSQMVAVRTLLKLQVLHSDGVNSSLVKLLGNSNGHQFIEVKLESSVFHSPS